MAARKKISKRKLQNSKILSEMMTTLGSLKTGASLEDLPLDSIHLHMLDENGDGIAIVIQRDHGVRQRDESGAGDEPKSAVGKMRLRKEVYNLEDYYGDDEGEAVLEVELESEQQLYDEEFEDEYDMEMETILRNGGRKTPLLN